MKRRLKHIQFVVFILGPLVFYSSLLSADTIVMKDGRRIEAEQVWREGEMVRYKKFGTIIGLSKDQVARVVRENPSVPRTALDFGFDHWKLGMPIGEVMAVAERENVPLHREGLVSANQHFNPQMCRPYIDTHSRSEKYGQPRKLSRNLLQKKACRWRLSGENTIDLVRGANWTALVYENATWKDVLQREETHSQEVERKVTHF